MDDYAKYEAESEVVRASNKKLLNAFAKSLKASNLKESTIKSHVENVDFYINEFLLYSDVIPAKDGVHDMNEFLTGLLKRPCGQAQHTSKAAQLV